MNPLQKSAIPFWESLLDKLADKLNTIQKQKEKPLDKAEEAMLVCRELLQELQTVTINHTFTNLTEEIHFFKEIKPKFYSRLIYYHKVYNIELGCPVGVVGDLRAYFAREMEGIKEFFTENRFYYLYLRSKETSMDEIFFLRNQKNARLSRIYDIHSHPAFSTNYDYLFSRIQANELLLEYLNKKLQSLNTQMDESANSTSIPVVRTLQWTDSKIALIEQIYAWKAKGSFKKGKATLKEIIDIIQQSFGVEITNPTRDFQEILRRKTGYSNYLNELTTSYLNYIDEIENKERR